MYTGVPSPSHRHLYVAFNTHLVDSHSVDISVIHKPDNLIGEELAIVLRGQVRLSGLRGIELKPLADSFT